MATERYRGVDAKALIALTLGLLMARLILSTLRSGPALIADEIGHLMNARLRAGGLPGQLELAPFYHGGQHPARAAACSDREAHSHLSAGSGAELVLAASVFPLLYVLLTRCVRVAPCGAGPGACGCRVPDRYLLIAGRDVRERAVSADLRLADRFFELLQARTVHGELMWAGAVGASAAALCAGHGRMIAAVILTAGVVALLGVRRVRLAVVTTALSALGAGLSSPDAQLLPGRSQLRRPRRERD